VIFHKDDGQLVQQRSGYKQGVAARITAAARSVEKMSDTLVQAAITLGSVALGGALSVIPAWISQRSQRKATLGSERRAREMQASGRAGEALSKLLLMVPRPDESLTMAELHGAQDEHEPPSADLLQEWDRNRNDLLLVVEVATLDLSDKALRERLDAAHELLELADAATQVIRWPESRVRRIACGDALRCLGAFRRGDDLPEQPSALLEALSAVDLQKEMWDANTRSQQEAWALEQAERRKQQELGTRGQAASDVGNGSPDAEHRAAPPS
jgi:hypothetical protein